MAHGSSRSTIPESSRRSARCPLRPPQAQGLATFVLANLAELHAALDRVYKLAMSLPEAPLDRFKAETANLPRTTEAERMVIQRIGQDVFRDALMDYWGGRCPMTGITEPGLLRASHIVPWADCTDAQRLDVHNGLLLSALWDAAFDRGLISFADDGAVLASLSSARPRARRWASHRAAPDRTAGLRTGQIWRCTGLAMALAKVALNLAEGSRDTWLNGNSIIGTNSTRMRH